MSSERRRPPIPPIIIVSGGAGTSGELVVNTVLAQFPDVDVPVETVARVRYPAQLEEALAHAEATGGTIVHTLVDGALRQYMMDAAKRHGVVALDLMGPLIDRLSGLIREEPLGRPGFYRHLHRSYFERMAAIEYAVAHDDGVNREDWPDADVLLIGVSRTGKTPLSMYLSVVGWKAANLPLVSEIPVPPELFELDRSRVIGLTMDLHRLVAFRRDRARRIGLSTHSDYASPLSVSKELRFARRIFERGGFHVVDVSDKPVEASAEEVIKLISRVR